MIVLIVMANIPDPTIDLVLKDSGIGILLLLFFGLIAIGNSCISTLSGPLWYSYGRFW
jgi:hypothetical protein